MKALTLWQPWASLVACGGKRWETRSWSTLYRGPLAIHASARRVDVLELEFGPSGSRRFADAIEAVVGPHWRFAPLGCVVAVVRLVAVVPTEEALVDDRERMFGDFTPGRYAWQFGDVHALSKPLRIRGAPSLWDIDDDLVADLLPSPFNPHPPQSRGGATPKGIDR